MFRASLFVVIVFLSFIGLSQCQHHDHHDDPHYLKEAVFYTPSYQFFSPASPAGSVPIANAGTVAAGASGVVATVTISGIPAFSLSDQIGTPISATLAIFLSGSGNFGFSFFCTAAGTFALPSFSLCLASSCAPIAFNEPSASCGGATADTTTFSVATGQVITLATSDVHALSALTDVGNAYTSVEFTIMATVPTSSDFTSIGSFSGSVGTITTTSSTAEYAFVLTEELQHNHRSNHH